MVLEYIPDFSTVTEIGHCGGSVSVGPGMVEAFVVGTGVGGVVGTGVGIGVGVGVTTGWDGEKQPATIRRTASISVRLKRVRYFMKGILQRSISFFRFLKKNKRDLVMQ